VADLNQEREKSHWSLEKSKEKKVEARFIATWIKEKRKQQTTKNKEAPSWGIN